MMIGGLSECWHGSPLVPEVWDTHVPGGQTALSSLQGKAGCHWLKMRTCGPSLSRPMQEKLGCAKRLAGSSEDCELRVGQEAAAWPDKRDLAPAVYEEHLKALLNT